MDFVVTLDEAKFGATLSRNGDDSSIWVVTAVEGGSPANRAGLQVWDEIVDVRGASEQEQKEREEGSEEGREGEGTKTLPQRVREARRPCEISCRRRSKNVVPMCAVFHFKSAFNATASVGPEAIPTTYKLALLPGSPSGSGWVVLDENNEEVDGRSEKVKAFVERVIDSQEAWFSKS